MRLKLSQDRQGRPCDDWGCTQLVEMKRKQVGQLSCLDITGEIPDTNQETERGVQSYSGYLSGVSFFPPPVFPLLQQSLAERLQGGTKPDCGANGNSCVQ